MGRQIVVGAGPVGRAVAGLLAEQGEDVVLASRSGTGEELPGVVRAAVDAGSAEALSTLADGADAIYNCLNPPSYSTWERDWPPLAAALLAAAESSGAVLAITANLYPYGRVDGPMVEGMPDRPAEAKGAVRARMWAEALAAHQAGRVRVVEVRGSDYMGAGVGDNAHIPRLVPAALRGKAVRVLGSPSEPHTWTDVQDMARALVTVAGAESAWGRVWHAPSNPPRTQEQAVADVCAAAGRPPVPVRAYPGWLMGALAVVSPMMRELRAVEYQFREPFVMDSSAITTELGLEPTPWEQVCARTAGVAA